MSDLLEADARLAVPSDNLIRSVDFRAEQNGDGLTLDGYAAVFGATTEINGREGKFTEEIAPGAFKRSLGRNSPLLQFDHGQHPLIGGIPIGRITFINEDSHGLKVRAKLHDNWMVQPVRDAIRDGSITGMSFRFSIPEGGDTWTRSAGGLPHRTITNANLFEVGPVVWPAYTQTSVGVRSKVALDLLQDPDVRAELAHILASGTDPASLTIIPDLASGPLGTPDDLASGPLSAPATPTGLSRSKRVALALTR